MIATRLEIVPDAESKDLPTRAERAEEVQSGAERASTVNPAIRHVDRAEETLATIRDAIDEAFVPDEAHTHLDQIAVIRMRLEDDLKNEYLENGAPGLRREIMDLIEVIRELAQEIQDRLHEKRPADLEVASGRLYASEAAKLANIRKSLSERGDTFTPSQRVHKADQLRARLAELQRIAPRPEDAERHAQTVAALQEGIQALEAQTPVSGTRERSATRSSEQPLAKAAADVQRLYGKPPEKLNAFDLMTRRATMALMGTLDKEDDPYPLWEKLHQQPGQPTTLEDDEDPASSESNDLYEENPPNRLLIAKQNPKPPRPNNRSKAA